MERSLPKHYTPQEMKAAADRDRTVRTKGNINLLAAMHDAGVRRYILQSSGFWYVPGVGFANELVPFAVDASPGVAAGSRTYVELESAAFRTPAIECVALRYGFFYGPGTWYTSAGDMGEQVRQQHVPIIGKGEGVWSFVHIEDAAAATVAALRCAAGANNIVDDNPSEQRVWLPAFARACGAPEPPPLTEQQALATFGADSVYYATRL
jgi:2-alkyl-3-oxoalkanoate reductase